MRNWIAKIFLTALLTLAAAAGFAAEKVEFTASSPLTVAVGEAFRVEFSLNAKPDKDTFRAPSFEGFEVLAGPAVSHGSMTQLVNGTLTKSVSYTYTFVVMAQAAGNVTVASAEVDVDGTTYRTQSLPIEIVDEGSAGGGDASQPARRPDEQGADVQRQVAQDDILLRAVVSRTSVYKGEPLRVTFKLYERVNVVGYDNVKFPSFNGFWAQELNTDNARRRRETFNGKVYETLVAREFLLYPQQAGTLTIDPAELTAVAQVVVQSRHVDPFFGGGHEVYNVPRQVQSQRVNVTVKPLPAGAPASFNGAVGSFTLDATMPPGNLAANSAATYTVRIAGSGNLTFVQAPKLVLPGSFEQYNVKTTESINTSAAGISGYRQFEYPFIARAEGTYEIDPVEFTYFDPERAQYTTLRTRPLTLDITPDANGGGEATVVAACRRRRCVCWGRTSASSGRAARSCAPIVRRSSSARATGACCAPCWRSSAEPTWRCGAASASRRTWRSCAANGPTRSPCSVSGPPSATWRSGTGTPSTRRCSGPCGAT